MDLYERTRQPGDGANGFRQALMDRAADLSSPRYPINVRIGAQMYRALIFRVPKSANYPLCHRSIVILHKYRNKTILLLDKILNTEDVYRVPQRHGSTIAKRKPLLSIRGRNLTEVRSQRTSWRESHSDNYRKSRTRQVRPREAAEATKRDCTFRRRWVCNSVDKPEERRRTQSAFGNTDTQ